LTLNYVIKVFLYFKKSGWSKKGQAGLFIGETYGKNYAPMGNEEYESFAIYEGFLETNLVNKTNANTRFSSIP